MFGVPRVPTRIAVKRRTRIEVGENTPWENGLFRTANLKKVPAEDGEETIVLEGARLGLRIECSESNLADDDCA